MVTKNSIDSNIPIEASKGGTNSTSFASTNGVVYFDGTSLLTTASGSAGEVLTSNGTGSAPTYQTLQGAVNLISTQNASSSASIDFTGLTTYTNYFIIISNLVLSSNATNLNLAVSDDDGSTYKNSGYLSGLLYCSYNSATQNNVNATTSFIIGNSLSSSVGYFATLNLYNINTANPFILTGNAAYTDTTLAIFTNTFMGGNGPANIDAFQIIPASGTITSGSFSLYGYGA